jgi:predicted  nucleic acid-binding Zn-ribbon protein
MVSRWRVIEAVAIPMLTLLFLGLWQGYRHHTDAIRALRIQLHELEQQQTDVNSPNLIEEQLEFLQRRQQDLEKQIGESRRSQQYWRTQERQRRQSLKSAPKSIEPEMKPLLKQDSSLDLSPIP